jgi:hypothetical protein
MDKLNNDMKNKDKPTKAKNQGELLHHFAHQLRPSDKSGDYWYEGNTLYRDNLCIARILNTRKKIVLLRPFDRTGAFANGLNDIRIERAFDNTWTVYRYENILAISDNMTTDDKYNIAYYNIKKDCIHQIDTYFKRLNLINTKSFRSHYYHSNTLQATISKYVKEFNISEGKILKHSFNLKRHRTVVNWNGWNNEESVYNDVPQPISFWIDESKWFTPEQQAELDFKEWKMKHFNKAGIHKTDSYRDIYNDKDRKVIFEARCKQWIDDTDARNAREALKRKEENTRKNEALVEAWCKGENRFIPYNIHVNLRFNNGQVQTSQGAFVPIEDAKRLYQLYCKVKSDPTLTLYGTKDNPFPVGHYALRYISKQDNYYIIQVGCHSIRSIEIEKFIDNNNLQDWRL